MTGGAPLSRQWSTQLVRWYLARQRPLPWRQTNDPYRIWVSEVMLQQTQAATVIPYYERFTSHFPTLSALAAADLDDVLKLWEGLGYYSRARNLHRAARLLVEQHKGVLPRSLQELLALPGFGHYTAAAVASIAYGIPEPVVDGNVLRVLTRYRGITDDITKNSTIQRIREILRPAMIATVPSDFNQGLMELGALICTPATPKCTECPFENHCFARNSGRLSDFPHRRNRTAKPHYNVGVGVVWNGERFLITKRRREQMLGGLWELPGGKRRGHEALYKTVVREIQEEVGLVVTATRKYGTAKHAYSHFAVTLHAFCCSIESGTAQPIASDAVEWISPHERHNYAFPRGTRKVFALIFES